MKKLLTAASVVTLLVASGVSFAQAPGGMAPSAPSAGIQAGNNSGGADVPLETIVAALTDPQLEIGELSAIPADAEIQVVDLNIYLQADGAATLVPAITAAEGQSVAIQQALKANSAIQAQLNSRDVDSSDVVGFGVDGGKILLFTNSSANRDAAAGGAGVIQPAP